MIKARRLMPTGLAVAGAPRPSLPVSQYANDFALILRTPQRLRIARSKIWVLS